MGDSYVPWRVLEAGHRVNLKHVNLWFRVCMGVVSGQFVFLAILWFAPDWVDAGTPWASLAATTLAALLWISGVIGTGILAGVAHWSILIGLFVGLLATPPLLGLLMTAIVLRHARTTLSRHDLPLGLWGARRRDFEERWPDVCHGCGYDLRGLADRACPECGSAASPAHEPADRGEVEREPGDRRATPPPGRPSGPGSHPPPGGTGC